MQTKTMIMYDSPEAATWKTGIEGWVSSDGYFYGKDEHMARWVGSTHRKCDQCGTIVERQSFCHPCRDRKMDEKFATYPIEKWDGDTPLCVFDSDTYFFDADEILYYLEEQEEGYEVRLCKCKPGYLHFVEEDTWRDDLPDDGELPDDVVRALAALNEAIKKAPPVCYWEDKVAIDMSDLMKQVGFERSTPKDELPF